MSNAAAARRAAQAILAEGRFHQPGLPRPLHGLLATVGHWIAHPLELVNRVVQAVGGWFPGGVPGVWAVLGCALAAWAAVIASRRTRGRLVRPIPPAGGIELETAGALERQAAAAEREGRWREAVRLRFRAGVARLSDRDELSEARSMTSGQIARIVRSDTFASLARRFEEIVYGGAAATREDAEAQRRGWPEVLAAR